MPKREQVYEFVIGESQDQARPAKRVPRLREMVNLVPNTPQNAEGNKIMTMDGAKMMTQRFLQRSPIFGAVGNVLDYPGQATIDWLGYEDDTQTASGLRPAWNADDMSDPNSSTFIMLAFPDVQGNVFCNVNNGDGRYFPFGAQAGLAGEVQSVYNELWGGAAKIPSGYASAVGSPKDTSY